MVSEINVSSHLDYFHVIKWTVCSVIEGCYWELGIANKIFHQPQMLWLCFAFCFLTVFQSSSSRKIGDNEYKGTTWQIKFSIDWLIEGGIYKLRLALASVHNSNLQVWIQKHQWLSFNMMIGILYFSSTNFDETLSRFVSMMLLQILPCFRLEKSGEIMQLLGTGFVESIGCLVWTYQL